MGKFRKRATGRYNDKFQKNNEIKFYKVKVISSDWQWAKEVTRDEAIRMAESEWLDLVLISANSVPPICKIVDYWQFLYQQKKKENEQHKKNKKTEVKEIRLTFNIWQHDFEVKLEKAKEFLAEKDFVKLSLQFKWREISHPELWFEKIRNFVDSLKEVAKPEKEPEMVWKQISLLLVPIKSK